MKRCRTWVIKHTFSVQITHSLITHSLIPNTLQNLQSYLTNTGPILQFYHTFLTFNTLSKTRLFRRHTISRRCRGLGVLTKLVLQIYSNRQELGMVRLDGGQVTKQGRISSQNWNSSRVMELVLLQHYWLNPKQYPRYHSSSPYI